MIYLRKNGHKQIQAVGCYLNPNADPDTCIKCNCLKWSPLCVAMPSDNLLLVNGTGIM